MLNLLNKLLFFVITLFSLTSKAMLQEAEIKAPKPKRTPSLILWLNTFDTTDSDENEKLSQENKLNIIIIKKNKFSKIHKQIQNLYKQKRLIKEGTKKAQKAKLSLDVNTIKKAINTLRIGLIRVLDEISSIQDDSKTCEKLFVLCEDLKNFADTFLVECLN